MAVGDEDMVDTVTVMVTEEEDMGNLEESLGGSMDENILIQIGWFFNF